MFVGALCHDLDHRGFNNKFMIDVGSPLAAIYSTSTMEHHHFDQCLMLLNSQGNQLLANVSREEFRSVILLVEDSILATDLAVYFRRRGDTFSLLESRGLDWSSNQHRSLVRGMRGLTELVLHV